MKYYPEGRGRNAPDGGCNAACLYKLLEISMLKENSQSQSSPSVPAQQPERVPQAKTFKQSIDICLKDSNAYGNTYFARYFEWQGICREQWFFQCFPFDYLQSLGVFITKYAHQEYVQETFPFQKVECLLNAYDIKQCSFNLRFRFLVGGQLVSSGYQKIVFANHNKKIIRLPQSVIDGIREYEVTQLDS
ncbi:MAG TPA: acyl-CoA thioesterase [Gallionella sp.]|nr:acyl-CoA thioesterase [Gallionella sp.]